MTQGQKIATVLVLLAGLWVALQSVRPRPRPPLPYLHNAGGRLPQGEGVLNLAHRGASGLFPENTLLAFREALRLGADALETDVHLSQDGQLVVIHDETVDRTTEGAGSVAELTVAELKALDAGYDFGRDGTHPFRGRGLRIPTLEEVFAAFPQARINIEIKPDRKDGAIERELWRLIEKYRRHRLTLVNSEHDGVVQRFRGIAASAPAGETVPTGAPFRESLRFLVLSKVRWSGLYSPPFDALQVPERFRIAGIDVAIATPQFIAAAHRAQVAVHVWTVDDPADMRRLIGMGVDGIITNHPEILVRVLGSKSP